MRPEQHFSPQSEIHAVDWDDLADSTAVAALVVSTTGRVAAANRLLADLVRMGAPTDLVGRSLQDLMMESADWAAWANVVRGGRGAGLTLRLRRSDGVAVFLRGDVNVIDDGFGREQLLGLFVDRTEEQLLRQAMQRSARLEALGSLTSGVAHDFNNLLTVLVGNLSLVAEELRDRPDQFAKLKAARDASKRGADLIRQLLAFARHQPVEANLVRPTKVVGGLVPLLSRALGAKVRLETELDADSSAVRGNAAQLESVVVNLAVNARDALEASGKVVIRVADELLRSSDAERVDLPPGNYVRIAVSDDGSGIPAETLARVFEPFFSTKGDRGGTGLGLAMVRAYAEQFRGAAHIDSVVGKGTTVSLYFPRSAEAIEETAAKTMPLSVLPQGHETILLMANEENLRTTVSQILEVLGYTVVVGSDAHQSLSIMRQRDVDLVIVDGLHMDGASAIIAGAGPDARYRVLQLSSNAERPEGRAISGPRTLMKPFALAELAQSVRATLDSA